jgi:transcriptional regulator with XRE-family HTH domain
MWRWNPDKARRIRETLGVSREALAVASGVEALDVKRLETTAFRRAPGADLAGRVVEGFNVIIRKMDEADGQVRRRVELRDLHDVTGESESVEGWSLG